MIVAAMTCLSMSAQEPKDLYADQAWAMYNRLNGPDDLKPADSYDNAIKLFKMAEEAGNTGVYNTIGYIYANYAQRLNERRTLDDKAYAAMVTDYYNKAIAHGSHNAYYNLGQCYEEHVYYTAGFERDFNKAVEWYQKGVKAGNTFCLVRVGDLYCDGVIPAADGQLSGEVAFRYYLKANKADAKNGEAYLRLGQCYERGTGVDADIAKAAEYYIAGAPFSDECLVQAALCYESGKGVAKDLMKACDMYGKALDNFYTADWVIEHHERLARKLGRE